MEKLYSEAVSGFLSCTDNYQHEDETTALEKALRDSIEEEDWPLGEPGEPVIAPAFFPYEDVTSSSSKSSCANEISLKRKRKTKTSKQKVCQRKREAEVIDVDYWSDAENGSAKMEEENLTEKQHQPQIKTYDVGTVISSDGEDAAERIEVFDSSSESESDAGSMEERTAAEEQFQPQVKTETKREKTTTCKRNDSLPIVPTRMVDKSCSNESVVPLLLNAEKWHCNLIASKNPVQVENNARFMIDLDKLDDPEDLLSDDLGSWTQTKTRKKCYLVQKKTGKISKITRVDDGTPSGYVVCRRPFVNGSDSTLHKTIIDITLPDGEHHNIVFVKYEFVGSPEHRISVKQHGNSKCSIPYLRTYKSTRNILEKTVQKAGMGIKRTLHEVEVAVGGLNKCSSSGALPRNDRQTQYMKAKNDSRKCADPIFSITELMKTEEEKFVRNYSLDNESPKVILYSDQQVNDVINFCCNEKEGYKSLLYVDVTFKLGPFFLLATTYRNTTLHTKRSNPPVCPTMLGPVMLCMLKDSSTYLTLFQKLSAEVPGMQVYLQGYCTDSEEALREVLAQAFPGSVAFLCKIHAKKNIQEKCRKLRLSQALTDEILNDIFASGGLVYKESEEEYRLQLDSISDKWDTKEREETSRPANFSAYFHRYKADDIWHHISSKSSRDAGFGEELPTTNIPESMNALIKRWQDFSATDMASFVEDLRQLVDRQRRDVQRAFLGLPSPFVVRQEYRANIRSSSDFFDGDFCERERSLKSDFKVIVDPQSYRRTKNYRSVAPQQRTAFPELAGTNNQSTLDCQNATGISLDLLNGLLSESDIRLLENRVRRLQKEMGIREGFDANTFLVKSISSPSTPHLVKALANSGFQCDAQCLGYKSRKICAHTVLAAHRSNSLDKYLNWYKRNGVSNLTALTTFAVNKSAGQKKPSRQRRPKSPDVAKGPKPLQKTLTLGDVLTAQEGSNYTVQNSPTAGSFRMTIRRARPAKPEVAPTTSTPFQLIELNARIKKCAGCFRRDIREGPDNFTRSEIDNKYCIRHKEHDFVWVESTQHWKKTFENKHYHVFANCLKGRNSHFVPNELQMNISHTLSSVELGEVTGRLNANNT